MMPDQFSRKGRFVFIAEAFAVVFLFLLPLKFGAIIGIPAITMIYWREFFPLLISPWPSTLFPLFAALLLLVTILCVPKNPYCSSRGGYALLWLGLAVLSPLGTLAQDTIVNYSMHMIPYCFGLGAFAMALAVILDYRPSFANRILLAVACAAVFSLISALSQYFSGFEQTLNQVLKTEAESGVQFQSNLKSRLMEQRISADFSACNAYAGYLLLALPVLLAALWKAGSYVTPPLLSRFLFTVPALGVSLFVLLKTGSRGALLSGAVMLILSLLCVKNLPAKLRYALLALIPLGGAAFALMLALGRGTLSIVFRFDYFQGAFRMMLDSPLTGKGWGGFVLHFLTLKLLENTESPNSPHNFPLTVGSQLGVAAFLIALVLVLFALYFCYRFFRKHSWNDDLFKDDCILKTAAVYGLAAWTFHAMMEVSFETPASMALAIAVALAVLSMKENVPRETPVPRHPRFWKLAIPLASVVLIFGSAVPGWKLIQFELAYERLTNMVDIRFRDKENQMPPDQAEVLRAAEACDRIAPRSPYQMMTVSNYFLACKDPVNAEKYLALSLKRAPEMAFLHYRKYMLLRDQPGRSAEAMEAVRTAAKLAPKSPTYKEENL